MCQLKFKLKFYGNRMLIVTSQLTIPQVLNFYILSIVKVKEKIVSGEFKTNCAIVILDFMIRHGVVQADTGESKLGSGIEGMTSTLVP